MALIEFGKFIGTLMVFFSVVIRMHLIRVKCSYYGRCFSKLLIFSYDSVFVVVFQDLMDEDVPELCSKGIVCSYNAYSLSLL